MNNPSLFKKAAGLLRSTITFEQARLAKENGFRVGHVVRRT
jgi:hypothetical protein